MCYNTHLPPRKSKPILVIAWLSLLWDRQGKKLEEHALPSVEGCLLLDGVREVARACEIEIDLCYKLHHSPCLDREGPRGQELLAERRQERERRRHELVEGLGSL